MKTINLDQMKNMSIDNLIGLYRNGYRLEEHTSTTLLPSIYNLSNIHTLQGPLLDPVTNFGKVTVSSCTGGCTSTATEITVDDGSKFPDPATGAFNLIWWNSTDYPDPADDPNKEIVRCTAKSGNVLTITRAQEGTSASVKNISTKIYKMILSITKKTISDINSVITTSTDHIAAAAPHSGHDTPAQRDTAIANHTSLTTAHGSVGTVLGITTADGRYAPIANGVTNGNAHDHSGGDGAQINHTTLSNIGTNTHNQIDTAITASIGHIAAAAPHSGHDTPAQRDTAIGTAVGNHTGLITGVHGVTGSYILGTEDIGVINGIAGLDSSGKVPISQLPALALTNVYTVANQVAQLALFATTQEGDVAIRTDENRSYVRNAGVSGTMADWSLLLTPTDAVLSVFGRTGAVAATTNDYTWAQINKATSSIGDITTRSHTLLSDIGVYDHVTIDTHMTSATAHGSTSAATANAIIQRDAAGRAKIVAPSAIDDIARKDTVDAVQTNLTTHGNLTTAHGSDGTILGLTTADGRYAPVSAGVTNGNAHDHSGGDGAQINHTTLSNIGTNTHASIDTAISASTGHIAAAAPHSGHDTPSQRDTAITNHANLVTGVHGTTTGYILGTEDMGVANGVASLDASGKVLTSQLPGLAITSVYTAINQAAQLALTTQEGDVVVRSDENKSYVRNAGLTGTMTDYTQLLTPTDIVTSVFGRTGVVTQAINDYTWTQINKATSSIADITTRSHTSLTDIGANTHAQIDTAINTTLPGLVTSHAGLTTAHGSIGTVLGITTADGRYAPVSAGVTNGNAHDHSGGDGAQINHTTLSNIGTNTHAQIDSHIAATGISVHGLGTISTQASSNVSITGGSITGITDITVADGGTGRSTTVPYAPICGGTTTTDAMQSVASIGTAGQVLTSNGAGTLPTFQTAVSSGIARQMFPDPIVNNFTNESNIDDLNNTTYAEIYNTNGYLTYDLGSSKNIILNFYCFSEVFNKGTNVTNSGITVRFQISSDNTTWTDMDTVHTIVAGGVDQTIRISTPIRFIGYTRYLRFYVTYWINAYPIGGAYSKFRIMEATLFY